MFDIVSALVLVALGIIGFLRGFISAVMSFVGLFCGTYFAYKFSKEGTALFLKYFPNVDESIANIAAMAIMFFCVAIAFSIVSKILCSLISFAKLSSVNHMAGMLIGFATGFAFIVAVYGAITLLAPEIGKGWKELSIFMNLAEKFWPPVHDFLMSHGFLNSLNLAPQTP
jgi:uncharacterized membrane protein required for colicin V production